MVQGVTGLGLRVDVSTMSSSQMDVYSQEWESIQDQKVCRLHSQ